MPPRGAQHFWRAPCRLAAGPTTLPTQPQPRVPLAPAVSICPAGTGGATCATCLLGQFSTGGTQAAPKPPCSACPATFTTAFTGANSSGACNGEGPQAALGCLAAVTGWQSTTHSGRGGNCEAALAAQASLKCLERALPPICFRSDPVRGRSGRARLQPLPCGPVVHGWHDDFPQGPLQQLHGAHDDGWQRPHGILLVQR